MFEHNDIFLHWREDDLPEGHPLANQEVFCRNCYHMVHCFNNEKMRPWLENCGDLSKKEEGQVKNPEFFDNQREINNEDGVYEGIYCFDCFVDSIGSIT